MARRRTRKRRATHRPPLLAVGAVAFALFALATERPDVVPALVAAAAALGTAALLLKLRRRPRRPKARSLGQLLALSPADFEDAVAVILSRRGYRDLRRVGGAGDLGADLVGRDRQGRSVIVQCKRYAPGARVGSPALQSFIGMQTTHHRAERGLFVTTAGFTAPAVALAARHGVTLIDGAELSRLVGR